MLRITVERELDHVSIKPEGSIAGVWVDELKTVWKLEKAERDGRPLRLDLSQIDDIDKAGSYLLALFNCFGIELIASGVFMIDLVLSIERDWPVSRRSDRESTALVRMTSD